MTSLIVEDSFGGHQEEYLMAMIPVIDLGVTTFLLHEELAKTIKVKYPEANLCVFDDRFKKGGFAANLRHLIYIIGFCKSKGLRSIFHCYVDVIFLPSIILLPYLYFLNFKISGIVFKNPVLLTHSTELNNLFFIKDNLKRVIYNVIESLPFYGKLLVLDKFYASIKIKNRKIFHLPDPISVQLPGDVKKIKDESVTFLCFGYQDERKGTLEFLDTVERVCTRKDFDSRSIIINICGRASASYEEKMAARIESLEILDNVIVQRISGFIPLRDLKKYIISADILVACYRGFYWPSGVLNWALSFRKNIFTTRYGYIGSLLKGIGGIHLADSFEHQHLDETLFKLLKNPDLTDLQAQAFEELSEDFSLDRFQAVLRKFL